MATALTPDETFVLSIWLEAMLYGAYLGLFFGSVYIIVRKKNYRTMQCKIMFGTMFLMFFLATIHISMNLYRMLNGYVRFRDAPGGPSAYFADLAKWDHIFKDTVFATQSIIGDALAIYNCFLVWDHNFYIIAFPVVLMTCSTVSGYVVAWLFTTVSNASIFSPRLNSWIIIFCSLTLAQNMITTGLIAYRVVQNSRATPNVTKHPPGIPIVRVVVESAAIYVVAQFVFIVLYAIRNPAQYIILETITPIIGMVFTSITVRLALHHGSPPTNTITTIGGTIISSTGHRSSQTSRPIPLTVYANHTMAKDADWREDPAHVEGEV